MRFMFTSAASSLRRRNFTKNHNALLKVALCIFWWNIITFPLHTCAFSIATISRTKISSDNHHQKESTAIFADIAASCDRDRESLSLLKQADTIRNNAIDLARRNEYSRGLDSIRHLLEIFKIYQDTPLRIEMLHILDDAVATFITLAFRQPCRGRKARWRVDNGLEALQMQLSAFPSPYDQVPRHLLIDALRALSAIISQEKKDRSEWNASTCVTTDMAFRIFQRLLTGVGVRNNQRGEVHKTISSNTSNSISKRQAPLSERDFNAVLNAVANAGRMDLAHKVVALQERTPNAPPITPVTYSIMLKGYGRLRDTENVEMILQKAEANGVDPDTVMLNSILDALVNCNKVDKAIRIFGKITSDMNDMATPNLRTYNTMLKGFAMTGAIDQAKRLTTDMKEQNLWDAVTTNTLVNAAVNARDFEYAEHVLSSYVELVDDVELQVGERHDHLNVEAYTQLLDGYAKAGLLEKALDTLRRMRRLKVMPNEYTYTCMIAGLARMNKFESAMKLLEFMEANGTIPTAVTYNAFISALTQGNCGVDNDHGSNTDRIETYILDQAIEVLRRMMTKGVRPTVNTISTLLEAFAKSSCPRIGEAITIVQRFEQDQIIPKNDVKVSTAMMRVYGAAQDIKGALGIFRRISKPDVVAVNAFISAACRCGEVKIAFETFDYLFGPKKPPLFLYLSPDVITFSILITSQLRLNSAQSVRKAQDLYREMRSRGIAPDCALVDMILAAMTKGGRIGLQKGDLQFTKQILKDAKSLSWKDGELEERNDAVRSVMVGRMSEIRKLNEDYYGMKIDKIKRGDGLGKADDLLQRKGWNKVDSGFRLWGGGDSIRVSEVKCRPPTEPIDDFLASKGWNDVDSAFRLF